MVSNIFDEIGVIYYIMKYNNVIDAFESAAVIFIWSLSCKPIETQQISNKFIQ